MIMTFKQMLWIDVLKKWILYQLVKNHISTVLKLEYKMEYAGALSNWKYSDLIMNLAILVIGLKEIIPGNQDDR